MSRYLTIDVGAGTMDVLYFDDETGAQFKAVVQSPVRSVAQHAQKLPGNLLVTGTEMGGGPVTAVLKDRAATSKVVITESAATTLAHDKDRVLSMGLDIIGDDDIDPYLRNKNYSHLYLSDIDVDRIHRIVDGFGVTFSFDTVAVCGQDHGVPPPGVSHLDYRHRMFVENLKNNPFAHSLVYRADSVPKSFNRLNAMAAACKGLPAEEFYVMDSGMAAITGAAADHLRRDNETIMILDVATSHTVGAALTGDEIAGFFEYHTADITLGKLEILLQNLAEGRLDHESVLAEGGHGAYIRKAIGFETVEEILATGPKRHLIAGSRLPITYGAPLGDNMMTGTVGLLEAVRRANGMAPQLYI